MENLKEKGLNMLRFLRVYINVIYDYKYKDRLNRSENNGILFWLSEEEQEMVNDLNEQEYEISFSFCKLEIDSK